MRGIEVKDRRPAQVVLLTTNEWYKAEQLAETYWLCVVWDPLGDEHEMSAIRDPAGRLDHAKREMVATRYFKLSAEAVKQAAWL